MIPERAQQIEVDSDITGRVVGMKLHEESTAHLMDVLATLYSDAQMAVLREASTNARDSHIEAGCPDRPIEISLPTPLDRCLRIKDYGVGMDSATISEIYSQYGASTKRGTNTQNGMLGLGCKSPFAYTSQYTVVAVKDHVRTTVSVSREDDGTGSMTILEQVATTEPNGVEVIVPAKEHNQFAAKARELFQYWPKGSVLVDGEEPTRIEGLKVTDEILLVKCGSYREDTIVMGGVPYPATFDVELKNHRIVAFVPIGSVIPAPARESLKVEAKATKATLARIPEEFRKSLSTAIQAEIDAAANPYAALGALAKWREVVPKTKLTCSYQGRTVPTEFSPPSFTDDYGNAVVPQPWILTQKDSRRMADHDEVTRVGIGMALRTLWVTNFVPQRFNYSHKKKLDEYRCGLDNAGLFTTFVLSRTGFPPNPWINPDHIVDWETIKEKTRDAYVTPRGQKVAGTYTELTGEYTTNKVAASAIDTSKPLIFINSTTAKSKGPRGYYRRTDEEWYRRAAFKALRHHYPDATILFIPTNRVDKFRRDFPMAIEETDALHKVCTDLQAKLTKRDLTALAIRRSNAEYDLKKMDASRVDDPALRRAIKAAKHKPDPQTVQPLNEVANLLNRTPYSFKWDNPLDRYPLMDHIPANHDHTYLYLNTVFATEKGTN